ncbi:MAG: cation:proton antiporter subunit C [Anaerovoracaceae bacterium]
MIDQINLFLQVRGIYALTIMLFCLGIFGMIICKNYMKKLMCMNIMQVSVIFLFLCLAQKTGGTIPVTLEGIFDAERYVNPLPHALMLTAIVVGLGTTGVGLALIAVIKHKYGTVDETELIKMGEDI